MLISMTALLLGQLPKCKICHETILKGILSERQIQHVITVAGTKEKFTIVTKEKTALVRIARKESTFNSRGSTSLSSSYGLWGFLDSTWRLDHIKMKKTDCAYCQTQAAMRYIKNRYGTAQKAWEHHVKTSKKTSKKYRPGGWY